MKSICLFLFFTLLLPPLFGVDSEEPGAIADDLIEGRRRLRYNEHLMAFSDDFSYSTGRTMAPGSGPTSLENMVAVSDPIEGFNRSVFLVNEGLMLWLVRPLTRGYSSVAPKTFRVAVSDASFNIEFPARLFSCLCQAKLGDAGVVAGRFFINTTVGVGGLYDAAYEIWGLRKREEDFGQVFASWGIGPGCYLFLPLHGSSTVRDGVGLIFDYGFDPKTYAPVPGVGAFVQFNEASLRVNEFERALHSFKDPYWTIKDLWYMGRRVKIAN